MPDIPPLDSFGDRIMICGPSNAGKSTLAVAIGRRLGVPAIHLDQLHHLPGSDWTPRPRAQFEALHADAIEHAGWVMDGNYRGLFPARLSRATGIILLDSPRLANLARYIRRTLFERERPGALAANRDSLKWRMVQWILFSTPPRMRAYRQTLPRAGLPYLELRGMAALNQLYAAWGLTRK